MADLETDLFEVDISVLKVFQSETWPTAFSDAPQCILMSLIDKKKAGCKSLTSTGGDVSCETDPVRVFLYDDGFEDEKTDVHPQRDGGVEQIDTSKVYQSISFNDTFDSTPIVLGGHEGTTAGGKKVSADSITTTGCDLAGEVANEYVNWCVFEIGSYE